MDLRELLEVINLYSMFSFYDGRNEPGMVVSRYNILNGREEFRFVHQSCMQAYKEAFEKFDRETCDQLSERVDPEDLLGIRSVSLSDFKKALEMSVDSLINKRNFC